jgi:hypothetical protein
MVSREPDGMTTALLMVITIELAFVIGLLWRIADRVAPR